MLRYRVHLFVMMALLTVLVGVAWTRSAPPIVVMHLEDYPEPLALPATDRGAGAKAVVRAASEAERRACRDVMAGRPSIVCEAR